MSKSCHDRNIGEYWVRSHVKWKNGEWEASYQLRNPETKRSYTLGELVTALSQRKEEFPHLSPLIDLWLAELIPKAQAYPHMVYAVFRVGETKALAIHHLKEQCLSKLEALSWL